MWWRRTRVFFSTDSVRQHLKILEHWHPSLESWICLEKKPECLHKSISAVPGAGFASISFPQEMRQVECCPRGPTFCASGGGTIIAESCGIDDTRRRCVLVGGSGRRQKFYEALRKVIMYRYRNLPHVVKLYLAWWLVINGAALRAWKYEHVRREEKHKAYRRKRYRSKTISAFRKTL